MVGVLQYFPSQTDALAVTNMIATSGSYTVGTYGGFSSWMIASNSTGSSSQSGVYSAGANLNADGYYRLYPSAPCFLTGSKILCQVDGLDVFVPVEKLKCGTLVKTSRNGYKKVELIGKGSIQNPGHSERTQHRVYKCSPSVYPELIEDLYITGDHSILVDKITDAQKEGIIKLVKRVFVTDKKYRLMASVDERAEPWASEGDYTVWHFALENSDPKMNYGIYVNGGLLVETCCIDTLKNKSNMTVASVNVL
jgi:Hint domain